MGPIAKSFHMIMFRLLRFLQAVGRELVGSFMFTAAQTGRSRWKVELKRLNASIRAYQVAPALVNDAKAM